MQRLRKLGRIVLFSILLHLSVPAVHAYVGPGAGITMLGTFWAVVSMAGVFISGMLIWPIRSFLRRIKTDDEN